MSHEALKSEIVTQICTIVSRFTSTPVQQQFDTPHSDLLHITADQYGAILSLSRLRRELLAHFEREGWSRTAVGDLELLAKDFDDYRGIVLFERVRTEGEPNLFVRVSVRSVIAPETA